MAQNTHFYIPADSHIQGVGPSLISEHTLEAFGFKFQNSGLNKYLLFPLGMKEGKDIGWLCTSEPLGRYKTLYLI